MINNLRVIRGSLKGRPIISPTGSETRPTADRTRESLFQLLETRYYPAGLEELTVLDLFAGSGALGIEALSRGAAFVHAFESGGAAGKAMRHNLKALGLEAQVKVHNGALPRSLESYTGEADLVLCDPPYDLDAVAMLQNILPARSRARAILLYEHEKSARPVLKKPWRLLDRRTWGLTTVSIFRLEGESTPA